MVSTPTSPTKRGVDPDADLNADFSSVSFASPPPIMRGGDPSPSASSVGKIKGGNDPSPSAPSVGASFSLPPVVLRVLPLQGSSAPVGFIYDATPDPIDGGLLAAASAFFTHQGHQVFHDPCPDFVAYCGSMELQPSTVVPVDRLPDYLLSSGLDILAAAPSPTVTELTSMAFMAAYLSPSQPGAVMGSSNPPLSTPSQTSSVGLSRSLHTEPGGTYEGSKYGGSKHPSLLAPPASGPAPSCRPDPDEDVSGLGSLPSSVTFGNLHSGTSVGRNSGNTYHNGHSSFSSLASCGVQNSTLPSSI